MNYKFIITEADVGIRLDYYLAQKDLPQSRSQIKRAIDKGYCLVNQKIVRPSKRLQKGDLVMFTPAPAEPNRALPEKIPLCILFEDEHLLVVDKPSGMVVHPAAGHYQGTLVNALLDHCQQNLSNVGGPLRPGIVHRLDKLTSGILVVSKNDCSHLGLTKQFSVHSVERRYLAVVVGHLPVSHGTYDSFHSRHASDRKKFTSRRTKGRRAITHYKIISQLKGATLVEAQLATGRAHQVRVHFSDAGYPILGDTVYGRRPKDERLQSLAKELGRQALHAHVLGFDHPITGEHLRFTSPLPPDISTVINALK